MNLHAFVELDGPLLTRRDRPDALTALDSAVRKHLLVAVLPGVYLASGLVHDLHWRMAAAQAWRPDAVFCGVAAAWAAFWPEVRVDAIDVATRTSTCRPGYRFHRREVPPDLIRDTAGLRITCAALTTVDLILRHGGDVIDRALRSRRVTLEQLWSALDATAGRTGNVERRRLLLDSRDRPWSAAERLAHRILRAAGIEGWASNYRVESDGRAYFIDIAFRGLRLAMEIDGRLHETDPDIFENDRLRQNALVEDGWTVLRFTYAMLVDDPDYVVRTVRRALRRCGP